MTYVLSPLILWLFTVAAYSIYRSTQLVEREYAKAYWLKQPVMTHVRYEKYTPVQLHASVIVNESVAYQSRVPAEHLKWATEDAVRKLLDGARGYIRIETEKRQDLYGTEIRASLDVYQRS